MCIRFACLRLYTVTVLKPGDTETFKTGEQMNYYGQSHVGMIQIALLHT